MDACGGKRGGGFILPTLLKHLKGILEQYPDDGQILKELIQNADDAKARRVCFLYDKTSYGSSTLADAGLAKFQGPALYAYNDATFTEQDWEGIRMLSDSKKANDKMKVGRFGLGFKSVFHITDMPGLLSGDGLVFYEPHEDFFTEVDSRGKTQRTATKEYDLKDFHSLYHGDMKDQLEPFIVPEFGATEEALASGQYKGTIFRFPLRTPNHNSELSPVVYDDTKICGLLDTLRAQPEMTLLFLKYIEKIEVYEKNSGQPAQLLFSTRISNSSAAEVRENRTEFLRAAESQQDTSGTCDAVVMPYQFSITTTACQNYSSHAEKTSDWLMVQHLGGGCRIEEKMKEEFKDVKRLPWVGAAVEIRPTHVPDTPQGHVFCFLPLPLQERSPTGFHAHINGYFSVDHNRRHLKWATADKKDTDDVDIRWNQFLLSEVVSRALLELILYSIQCNVPPSLVYSLFPDEGENVAQPEWKAVLENLYPELLTRSVFHTEASGGQWARIADSAAGPSGTTAVFSTDALERDTTGALKRILLDGDVNLVTPPPHIRDAVSRYSQYKPVLASPALVRSVLKRRPTDGCRGLSSEQRIEVLRYILSDADFTDLVGITDILPLADGGLGSFTDRSAENVYAATDDVIELLPGLENKFLSNSAIDSDVREKLNQAANCGSTMLKPFTHERFPPLVKLLVPEKLKSKPAVQLSSLTNDWLEKVWQYINLHFASDLPLFDGAHLIPLGDGFLVRLDKTLPVILTEDEGSGLSLPAAVVAFLGNCKVYVLDELRLTHKQIQQFVSWPNLQGFLSCVSKLKLSHCQSTLQKLETDSLTSIRAFVAEGISGMQRGKDAKKLLKQLPLFQLIGSKNEPCSASEGLPLSPYKTVPFKLHDRLLTPSDDQAEKLTKYFGINKINESTFLKKFVFSHIHKGDYKHKHITKIMKFVLESYYSLIEQDPSLVAEIRKIPFVKTTTGIFVTPSEVFDNSDPLIVSILDGVRHIIDDTMSQPETLKKLKDIGIKQQQDVSMSDIVKVAEYIQDKSQTESGFDSSHEKSTQIILFLLKHLEKFKKNFSMLANILWMPITDNPPDSYPKHLRWNSSCKKLCRPKEMYSHHYHTLLGSVKTFAPVDLATSLEKALFPQQPEVSDVIQHLHHITNSTISQDDLGSIRPIIQEVYQFLQKKARGKQWADILKVTQTPIWVGDKFVSPEDATIGKPLTDLEPYIFTIPREMQSFTRLMTSLGVKDSRKISYVQILNRVEQYHQEEQGVEEQRRDLHMVTNILASLDQNQIEGNLPVPVLGLSSRHLNMVLSKNACYGEPEDDMEQEFTTEDGQQLFLLHPDVPFSTAKRLQIPHWRHVLLNPEELDIGEGYGQTEPLTTRIHNILNDYSDGLAVLKELIQNADDAGATEIRFLFDERQHDSHKKSLFDPGMKDLQGPSLFAYNNAAFTEQDFKNIIKLGGATKKEDTEKVGRFGLGFNAVYNLTDVPCFCSNNKFVVFDPHLTHLGNTIRRGDPGIKINLNNTNQVKRFKDQYQPFQNVFGCQIPASNDTFTGTLFRLPLRTTEQARNSEICKKHYSREDIIELFQLLIHNGDSLLLFLQNVKQVSLFHIPTGAESTTSIVKVGQVSLTGDTAEPFLSLTKRFVGSTMSSDPTVCYTVEVQCQMSSNIENVLGLKGVDQIKSSQWLICQAVGKGESYKLSTEEQDRSRVLLPVGGVAVAMAPAQDQSPTLPYAVKDSRLFCFLPLPLTDTGLPVHVNGYFSVSSDRRHLYEQDVHDKHDQKADWNAALMRDAVTEAYVKLINQITMTTGPSSLTDTDYYSLWPCGTSASQLGGLIWELKKSFLARVCNGEMEGFKGTTCWLHIDVCCFADNDVISCELSDMIVEAANHAWKKTGQRKELLVLPAHILASLRGMLADNIYDMAKLVSNAFIPAKFTIPKRDAILRLIISDKKLRNLLKGEPCIPASPDGALLRAPEQLIDPDGPLKDLYSPEDQRFPYFPQLSMCEGTREELMQSLHQIGMKCDDITWDELAQRCRYEEYSGELDMMRKRSIALMQLMLKKVHKGGGKLALELMTTDVLDAIRTAEFLPVKNPPNNFPISWAGNKKHGFVSPNSAFLDTHTNVYLLGSVVTIVDQTSLVDSYQPLAEWLGCANKPTLDLVIKQLEKSTISDPETKDLLEFKIITNLVYDHLTHFKMDASQIDHIQRPIWVGHRFVSPQEASLETPDTNLEPYVYTIPHEMKQFVNLLSKLGVKHPRDIHYVTILEKMQNFHLENGDTKEQHRDLQMACRIMNLLDTNSIGDDVPVPVLGGTTENLKLRPFREVCYGELDEDTDMEFITDQGENMFLLHPNVTFSTARKLGTPHWRHVFLNPEELSIGEGFGQTEPLTTRIHNILNDYSDGLAVLKELIQNADDAGATEIRFLFDERQHDSHKKSLFDPGMKDLQGPALFAYNNAAFTEQDFKNIIKLGGATKKEDTEKVGRFGLGFNAVYNLTDVPCFCSNNKFVVFDPHLTHLGNTIRRGDPGIKINLNNTNQVKRFKDQYQPFQNVFGCQIPASNDKFTGTLFRLPLRTTEQARNSEICKKHYSREDIIELFQLLIENGDSLLLFLQNVKQVSLFHIPTGPENVANMIKLGTINSVRENSTPFLCQAQQFMKTSGCTDPSTCSHIEVDIALSTNGQDILNQTQSSTSWKWIVSQAVGKEESYNLARKDASLHILPVGGVAVPLITQHTDQQVIPFPVENSRLFCFLPLPLSDTTLPVHVNGYFSVSSDRRNLYEQDVHDKQDSKAVWNAALMRDAVTEAYVNLLNHITEVTDIDSVSDTDYYKLWPLSYTEEKLGGLQRELSNSVLSRICNDDNLKAFKGNENWLSAQQCILADIDIINCQIRQIIVRAANEELKRQDKELLLLPPNVLHALTSHHTEFQRLTLPEVLQIYILPNMSAFEDREKIVLYALAHSNLRDLLKGITCIPVTPDGSVLQKPEDLIHPSEKLKDLYCQTDNRFPFFRSTVDKYQLKDAYHSLSQIGMKIDDIPWTEVAARCQTVASLTERDFMLTRSKALVSLLQRKFRLRERSICNESDTSISADVLEAVKEATFLPVMGKPNSYPLQWAGDTVASLISPNDAFLHTESNTNLIGSVAPFVDQTKLSLPWPTVSSKLGVNNQPTIDLVMTQMDIAMAVAVEPDRNQQLGQVFSSMYDWLNYGLGNGTIQEYQFANLKTKNMLWLQGYLYPINRCATWDFACPPYLQSISPDRNLSKLTCLWKTLGVESYFSNEVLIEVLQDIFLSVQTENSIACSLKIIKEIHAKIKKNESEINQKQVIQSYGDIYVPGEDGQMHKSTELCYNNCPWIPTTQGMNFCHSQITFEEAEAIGVKTNKQRYIEEFSSPLGEAFGQSELLTQRINRLLTGYLLGTGIIYELLQNADDARATEIHFVLDKRSHPTDRVFDECWEPLQGPALVVYNNKPFSPSDIAGIQKLGMGSKSSDPTKTGQYGVGFNCVYHLTDTPTIYTDVTGEGKVLCAFDPHCRYVPGANKHHPGRKFTNIDELEVGLPDVFATYSHPELFNIENATIFRFPLRTEEQAKTSKIANKSVPPYKLESIFKEFMSGGHKSLLFLNHLTSVRISVIEETGLTTTKSCMSVELDEDEEIKRSQFSELLTATGRNVKDGYLQNNKQTIVDYKLTLRTGEQKTEWMVVQGVGFTPDAEINQTILSAYRDGEMCLLPRGGVAVPLQKLRNPTEGSIFSILPLPLSSHGLPHINGHFALDYENRSSLAKKDNDTMQSAWNCLLLRDIISQAYVHLIKTMKHCTDESNLDYYHSLFPDTHNFDKDPYLKELFTCVLQTLADKEIPCLPVITTQLDKPEMNWYQPLSTEIFSKQVYFNNLPDQFAEGTSALARMGTALYSTVTFTWTKEQRIEATLLRTGFPLCKLPLTLRSAFEKAGRDIPCVSHKYVTKFYRTFLDAQSTCHIGELGTDVTQTNFETLDNVESVLEYCLNGDKTADARGLPLLVTENKLLLTFDDQAPVFLSDYAALFPEFHERFLHQKLHHLFAASVSSGGSSTVQEFSIPCMIEMLKAQLSENEFSGKEIVSMSQFVETFDCMRYAETWIGILWNYLRDRVIHHFGDEKFPHADDQACLSVLEPLLDWNLLPVKKKTESFLLRLRDVEVVIDWDRGDTTSRSLRNVFSSLPFMSLALPGICGIGDHASGMYKLFCKLRGSIDTPQSVIKAFNKMSDGELEALKRLFPRDTCLIRNYFADNLQKVKRVPNHMLVLQKLPIYLSKASSTSMVCLAGSSCYMVPAVIPNTEIDVFQARQGNLFLQTPTEEPIKKMLKYLGVMQKEDVEFYVEFCLIEVHFTLMMTEKGRIDHLQYIRDRILCKPRKETDPSAFNAMKEYLRNLAFIEAGDGEFCKACDFFDKNVAVFAVMETRLLPKPFSNGNDWHNFMKNCGLVHEVTEEQFIKYARAIEKDSATLLINNQPGITEMIRRKAFVLIEHMYKGYTAQKYCTRLLQSVKDIAFVPPHEASKNLAGLCPQYGSSVDRLLTHVKFQGSCHHQSEVYVWTSSNMVHQQALPERRYITSKGNFDTDVDAILKTLGVHLTKKLPGKVIVDNLVTLCSALKEKNVSNDRTPQTIQETLNHIYKNISEEIDNLSDTERDILKQSPVIAVDGFTKYIRASDMFTEQIFADIKPYLYCLPMEFGQHKDLFLKLGSTASPTIKQFIRVMNTIFLKSGSDVLNPEEVRGYTRCFGGFCAHLLKCSSASAESFDWINGLPLPNIQVKTKIVSGNEICNVTGRTIQVGKPKQIITRLFKSTDLVFNDKDVPEYRLAAIDKPLLADLSKFAIQMERSSQLVEKLPSFLKPQMLSTMLTEDLCTNVGSIVDCQHANIFKSRLKSPMFKKTFLRLALGHAIKTKGNPEEIKGMVEICCNKLQEMKIVSLDTLKTHYKLDGKIIEGSESCMSFFLAEEKETSVTLYFYSQKSVFADMLKLAVFSRVILRRFKSLQLCDRLFVKDLLACRDLNQLNDVLDELPEYDVHDEYQPIPSAGNHVPIEMFHLIDHGFARISKDSCVAYQINDPLDTGSGGEPSYIFVNVLEIIEEGDGLCCNMKYKVLVDNIGTLDVVTRDFLYDFQRCTEVDGGLQFDSDTQNIHLYQETIEEIQSILRFVLLLPPGETARKNNLIKRLCMKWNKGSESAPGDLQQKVAEFLDSAMNEQRGKERAEMERRIAQSEEAGLAIPNTDATTYFQNDGMFQNYVAQRTLQHQTHRANYQRNYQHQQQGNNGMGQNRSRRREGRSSQSYYVGGHNYTTVTSRNPQPGLAALWLRQAAHDLQAIDGDRAMDWKCFKSTQCVEKSLTAVLYNHDADRVLSGMDVYKLLAETDSKLPGAVRDSITQLLRMIQGDPARITYPRSHGYLPYRDVTSAQAANMQTIAQTVLQWARDKIKNI